VKDQADRVGNMIHAVVPPVAAEFLRRQSMMVASSVDRTGRVWASLLTGAPGFAQAADEATVRIRAKPTPGDPLHENLSAGAPIGLLAIEFDTRKRMRLNGWVVQAGEDLLIRAAEVYGNCPKYIQARHIEWSPGAPDQVAHAARRPVLTRVQQRWIAEADTFFLASYHTEGGADVSHRGGNPGFIRVLDDKTLVWPDYPGNRMFQTLGNLTCNPSCGLLFVDFDCGSTLQLTGEGRIRWEREELEAYPGAERLVEFRIEHTIETVGAHSLRVRFLGSSPFNPVAPARVE
jgi:predicted pyridoxine 5'-phosphate oxidase superfamily flavin-nucleotide-binding protein